MSLLLDFEKRVGYCFKKAHLLERSFTHPSSTNTPIKSYQNLEFLGDKVLGLCVSDFVYKSFPSHDEGYLSKLTNYATSGKVTTSIFLSLGLEKYIKYDKKATTLIMDRIYEDVMESIIAAIYLDSDFETVNNIVTHLWIEPIKSYSPNTTDPISRVQIILQQNCKGYIPEYVFEEVADGFKCTLEISTGGFELKEYCVASNKRDARHKLAEVILPKIHQHFKIK